MSKQDNPDLIVIGQASFKLITERTRFQSALAETFRQTYGHNVYATATYVPRYRQHEACYRFTVARDFAYLVPDLKEVFSAALTAPAILEDEWPAHPHDLGWAFPTGLGRASQTSTPPPSCCRLRFSGDSILAQVLKRRLYTRTPRG